MTPTSSTEAQRSSGEVSLQSRPERFRLEEIERLSIAIINRAILDLLEKGRHSLAAERWLLSREFDRIHGLLG